MPIANMKSWELSTKEIAFYAPKKGFANAASLQLYIPKIFLDQPKGIPKISSPAVLNSSCIINDKACKPTVSKTYKTQNYITVPRHKNALFAYNYFHQGDKIQVEVHHGDIDDIRVTNEVDNSTPIP